MLKTRNNNEIVLKLLQRSHNQKVIDRFGDGIDEPYFHSPEGELQHECIIKDGDDLITAIGRVILFNHGCNGNISEILDNIYGVPIDDSKPFYKCLVTLSFIEYRPFSQDRVSPKRLNISFRLNKKVDEVKPQELIDLKNIIDDEFDSEYFHYCGDYDYSYRDNYNDVRFLIPASNDNDANLLFTKLSKVVGFNLNQNLIKKKLIVNDNIDNEKIEVLGTKFNKHRKRSIGYVTLKSAHINLADKKRDFLINRHKLRLIMNKMNSI